MKPYKVGDVILFERTVWLKPREGTILKVAGNGSEDLLCGYFVEYLGIFGFKRRVWIKSYETIGWIGRAA